MLVAFVVVTAFSCNKPAAGPFINVSTLAGLNAEFGEPFGIAATGREMIVTDGQTGRVIRLDGAGKIETVQDGFDTPSAVSVSDDGVIVVDSGQNAIYRLDVGPTLIAGVPGRAGSTDGDAASATFNGPIGVAVDKGRIFVADTYNDRIRVIENGKVSTLAGGTNGFADGLGTSAMFNTPTGLAIWHDKLLVADIGNHRIRVVEPDGHVWTLAGSDEIGLIDGPAMTATLSQPTAFAVNDKTVYFSDSNAIRRIDMEGGPFITTISDRRRGLADGEVAAARFNRPSGLTIDTKGDLLVADSENRLIRRISASAQGHQVTSDEIAALRDKPDEFRKAAPPRWPFDPPDVKRDIAGTLGELRGEIADGNEESKWFHNGLDIAGAYGETARFIRDEKVLNPVAVENFETLRELIRMPTLGYIHIRLGRDAASLPFDDARFQFLRYASGKLAGVRVPRGTTFKAGEPLGTLNAMNHVHLIAGRPGSEMNALDALDLPGLTDTRPPVIEKIMLFDENWLERETVRPDPRIKLSSKTRVVVRAYDQMDGNADRRRLGVYQLGYQLLSRDGRPVNEPRWTISFARMPSNELVPFAYANGSRSGAKGETIFNYIVTNLLDADKGEEGLINPADFEPDRYILRVFAADRFGNIASKDIDLEVIR